MHKPGNRSDKTEVEPLFRTGPGYLHYWMHEALDHWTISEHEAKAVRDLGGSLGLLMKRRNEVEDARRRFTPAGSLARPTQGALADAQQALFEATSGFFLQFYSALSALAGVAVRFRTELRDEAGDPPHASNSKFLAWLEPIAMYPEHFHILTEARQFRAVLDHKASNQPYEWGTMVEQPHGLVRVMLHGPTNRSGGMPPGALQRLIGDDDLPQDHAWVFVAPDEDVVLTILAVQMNMVFGRINPHRYRPETRHCSWVNRLGPHDPDDGYPIFAPMDGTVSEIGSHLPEISAEDRAAIAAILAKYETDELPSVDPEID